MVQRWFVEEEAAPQGGGIAGSALPMPLTGLWWGFALLQLEVSGGALLLTGWPPCGTLVGAIVVVVGGFQCRGPEVGWTEVWGVKLRRGVRRRALSELNKEWVKYWGE